MGEFILKKMVRERGLAGRYHIESRATHTDEIENGVGNPIYPPAQRELNRRGVPFENRHSTPLQKADYDRFDLFLCMDDENIETVARIFGADPLSKVHKLMAYTGLGENVSDPWFTGDFSTAYNDIHAGCERFLAMEESDKT